MISVCFKSGDNALKTINWSYEIKDDATISEKVNDIKIDHIHEAQSRLNSILNYFNHISKNIYRKSEDDKEIAECKIKNIHSTLYINMAIFIVGANTRKT